MFARVLIDNLSRDGLISEWGLSLWIEYEGRKLLLDTGTTGRFVENARGMGVPLEQAEAGVLSHAHYDHFDPDSIPVMMANGHTELIGALDTKAECERLGIQTNVTYLTCGETLERGSARITGVPCDHGKDTPDALGLLFEISGKCIYIMGDTAYRPDYLEDPELHGVNLLILPINGAFGNLNEEQAAKVIKELKPELAVPCHYWNFAEHGGNPGVFQKEMAEIAPESKSCLMRQGEVMILR